MKRIRLTGIAPWARGGGWRGAFGALAAISLRVEPIPMPQFDPVVAFLSCTRRTFLVLGAALPRFLRSVVAALKGCTPSRSAVCLFALVLFLPSSTAAQAQTAPEITSGGPFTVAEGAVAEAQTVVRGPYLQSGTPSSVIIKWRTDEATDSVVRYGLDPDSLTLLASDSESTTEHAVQLTGLSADVKYFYSVGTSSVTLAGGDRDHFVVTAPVPGTAKPTRIWVIGDSGTADSNARAVRDYFLDFTGSRDPDLWIMLGDNAYNAGTDNEYQRAVFNTYRQVLPRTVLWPTLGNHGSGTSDSTTESGPYYDIFSLPRNGEAGGVASGTEAYYSFDYGNMHFVCLNSETDLSPDGAMMTWLEADLAANDKEWIIAFWHRPPYSRGSANSDMDSQQIALRQNAVPLLERYGVDLVLTGHTHAYERSYLIDGHYGLSDTFTDALKKNSGDGSATGDGAYQKPATVGAPHAGAVYVVAGTAGVIKTIGWLDHPAMAVSFKILGSMVLDVNGNRLDAIFLGSTRIGDSIRDAFTILKLPEVSGSVAENTAAGEEVVTVAGENPEADRTYSLAGLNGNRDDTSFTITAQGELQTNSPLDYEQPADADGNNIYEVVVSGEDGEEENGNEAGTDDSVLVTIHVTDMDEAGTVSLPPDPPQALTPLTARLDDPDRDAGHTVSWQWASSANRTGPWTAIGGATAPSYTPQASDVTKYLRATATYEDRHARNQSAFSDASAQVTAHVQLIAAPGALEIREGTTAAYSVVFNENPAELYGVECGDDVWVRVSHAEGTDVTLDRYSHPVSSGDGNCDGGNWNQPKSFQVSADRDDDADKDPLVTLTHEVWNTRAETVLTGPNVTVSIIEGADLEAPRIEGIEITSDPPDGRDVYGIGEEIEVTVTFSEIVMVTGTPRVTLKVGARDRSANYESVTGAEVVFAYTVAVNDSDKDGVSIEADSLSGGTIRDTATNNAVRTHSAVAADTGQQVDGIKPVLASTDAAVANGTMLTLAYSEPLDTSSAPGNDAFSVTGGNETRSVTGVRVSGSAVELTLTPAVEHGETGLRVSYTVPTGSGATPIQDTAGNDADRLSNQSVTNVTRDTTGPTVEMMRITSNAGSDQTYAVEDPIEVTVTFNQTVAVTGTPRLTLNVGGQNRMAEYLSVTGAAVKFEYRVSRGDSDRDGVGIDADSLSRGAGTIRDGAQNNATLDHAAVAADSRHKVDGIPPALATTDGAVVNGTKLTLAYSEPLNSSSRPAASAFTVTGGSETRTVTRVQVSGSAVFLTLSPAVEEGESGLRLSYQPGENPIEDTVGNAADGLNNQPVTNDTGDTTGPTVETVRITSNAGSDATYAAGETIEVTVTFSETVVVTGTPRLTLNLGGRSRTANYQDVTGAAVRFEYQVVSGDSAAYGVSIDANRLSGGTIRDGAQNDAVRNHAPVAADSRHQVDGIKPTLATSDGAVASGTTLTLAYGEAMDSSSVPATDDFTVTGGSETRTVTGVRVSGSAVFLTLSPAVADGESAAFG